MSLGEISIEGQPGQVHTGLGDGSKAAAQPQRKGSRSGIQHHQGNRERAAGPCRRGRDDPEADARPEADGCVPHQGGVSHHDGPARDSHPAGLVRPAGCQIQDRRLLLRGRDTAESGGGTDQGDDLEGRGKPCPTPPADDGAVHHGHRHTAGQRGNCGHRGGRTGGSAGGACGNHRRDNAPVRTDERHTGSPGETIHRGRSQHRNGAKRGTRRPGHLPKPLPEKTDHQPTGQGGKQRPRGPSSGPAARTWSS